MEILKLKNARYEVKKIHCVGLIENWDDWEMSQWIWRLINRNQPM